MSSEPNESFHWGWVVFSAAAGAGLIALAHVGDLVWKWPQITTGTLTNIGAAVVIAFVLFIIERRFTRSIRRTVATATRVAVEEETQAFNDRLSSLEDQVAARREKTASVQNAVVGALADNLNYDTVHAALHEARRVGATESQVTVRGSRRFRYPLVNFAYESRSDGPRYWSDAPPGPPRVFVSVRVEPRADSVGTPVIEAEWEEGKSAADLVSELDAQLRRRGYLAEAKSLDMVFAAAELSRGISLVIADQQASLGEEQLKGALIELIDDSWVITSGGLQNLESGYEDTWEGLRQAFSRRPAPDENPPAPDGVDDGTWDRIFDRVLTHAPSSWY